MSHQLTVRLPDDLSQSLMAAAARMERKRSEIVRMALSRFLELESRNRDRPAERVRHLIGSLETGLPDLAQCHREYILESLKRGE